jgi:phosphoribosyl 1,2-cyclic phosphate phosphodiesterase
MATLRFTILGCGSSGGVPRLGGQWGDCDPQEPRNRRRRCSLLVERLGERGVTRVLVDSSPDMRSQLLDAGIGALDGVVWTHSHADHVHGIDDLRMIVFNRRRMLDVWADDVTYDALVTRFGYAFETPPGSSSPPILTRHPLYGPIAVDGAGGPVEIVPIPVGHGDIDALGLRVGGLAYMPDVKEIPEGSLRMLEGLDVWVLDALRRSRHSSHLSLDEALAWIERMAPRHGVLTNMHVDLDWATVEAETPARVTPAWDGMVIELGPEGVRMV